VQVLAASRLKQNGRRGTSCEFNESTSSRAYWTLQLGLDGVVP